jgi:hypothetical protein
MIVPKKEQLNLLAQRKGMQTASITHNNVILL